MKIGIITALSMEKEQIVELLEEKQEMKEGNYDYVMGSLNGNELVIMESGIGKVNAAIGTLEMIKTHKDASTLIKEMGLSQVSDENALIGIIKEVIDANPQSVVDYKAGKDRAIGFIVGQVMKKTQGKANPALANKLILEEISRR